jgi:hypothetical protein
LVRLEESTTAPVFYARAEALNHLNDAMNELNLVASKIRSERSHPMTRLVNFYAYPTSSPTAIAILHVAYKSRMIEKQTLEAFDRSDSRWMRQYGTVKAWCPIGLNLFAVKPHFLDADETVTLTTLDMHQAIGEATTIDLEDEYLEALEDYVFHALRFKEGGTEFAVALQAYDDFLEKDGAVAEATMAERFVAWSREPAADTGPSYTVLGEK